MCYRQSPDTDTLFKSPMTPIIFYLSIFITSWMLPHQNENILLEINGSQQISDKYYEMHPYELKTVRILTRLDIAQAEYSLLINENRLSNYHDTRNWQKKVDFEAMKWKFKVRDRLLIVITDKSGNAYVREIRFI